ncbi:hypothetical protein K466DRAFT_496076 [Polyporus arcularius HHB13444]|uniref:Uncharacterized protein n=1 Tax=Polyporus arcularius HHB13444 TaxID=1314778 RepID=A0A5C3P7Z8_9APHY|nr:hypothetical protein K466DRAFT_496076 [Polyporus arcularius HHB13444]
MLGSKQASVRRPKERLEREERPRRKITVLPTGRQFAVVRMDPLAMVSHLDLDSVAIEEATAINPKKYLVYLDAPQDLPLPQSQWCRFWVHPVAMTLRPAVPEEGITSDMVLPIHPNTQFAKGRRPMNCTPQFPFPHCYLWIRSMMSLRVRTKRGVDVYDNDKAMTVSIDSHVAFMSAWNEDSRRMFALRRAALSSLSGQTPSSEGKLRKSPPPEVVQPNAEHSPSFATLSIPPPLRIYRDGSASSDDEDTSQASDDAESPHAPTLPPIPPLMELAIDTDVFGWAADPKVPFVPLVDLWFELEDHLSPANIPSPVELWREQETIGA